MKLQRHPDNPILKPDPNRAWESGATFNCGAVLADDGRIYLLYRAIPAGYTPYSDRPGFQNYVSSIGCAVSEDGVHFTRFPQPVVEPDDTYDRYGCEDPRVTRLELDGRPHYMITYTALSAPAWSGYGNRVALAITEDFHTYRKYGVIIPDLEDKDAVIFPELVGGRIVLLHRVEPDIQIAYFDNLEALVNPDTRFWSKYRARLDDYVIMRPQFEWESEKIGGGCPPIKTPAGWLVIYHAKDAQAIYRVGVAMLDLEDPHLVIARAPHPILEPEAEYERVGDVNNVVFPQGAVVLGDTLHVYYGAADKVCCLATASLSELVDFVMQFKR